MQNKVGICWNKQSWVGFLVGDRISPRSLLFSIVHSHSSHTASTVLMLQFLLTAVNRRIQSDPLYIVTIHTCPANADLKEMEATTLYNSHDPVCSDESALGREQRGCTKKKWLFRFNRWPTLHRVTNLSFSLNSFFGHGLDSWKRLENVFSLRVSVLLFFFSFFCWRLGWSTLFRGWMEKEECHVKALLDDDEALWGPGTVRIFLGFIHACHSL